MCNKNNQIDTSYMFRKDAASKGFKVEDFFSKTKYYNSPSSSAVAQDNDEILYNVAHPVASFTGRLEQLSAIQKALLQYVHRIQHLQAPAAVIVGLGGAGKTELARKYISNNRKFYQNILWIDANTPESIKSEFRQVHKHFLGIWSDCDINVTCHKVYERLSNSKSLFVFDNAEGFATIKPFLPPMLKKNIGNIHILFTSRIRDWEYPDECQISEIHLNGFVKADAEEFIRKTLHEKRLKSYDISDLAHELAYSPLALKQAIECINERDYNNNEKLDINDFLAWIIYGGLGILQKNLQEPPDRPLGHSVPGYNRYPGTVLNVFSSTFEIISRELNGQAALEALSIIAYLPPDYIEIKMFDAFDGAVLLLKKYSILTVDKGMVSVHRLVQQIARLQNKNNEKDCIMKALTIVNNNSLISQNFYAMCIWTYAIKHYDFIEKFYFTNQMHTPLHLFIIFQKYEASEALLEKVDSNGTMKFQILNSVNEPYGTPLRTALVYKRYEFLKLLCKHGATFDGLTEEDGFDLLNMAINCDNWDYLRQYLKDIRDVHAIVNIGATILVGAIRHGKPNIIKLLIEKGVDVNVVIDDSDHILHTAIDANNLEYLKSLVQGGADVNTRRHRGLTSLHAAVYKKNVEIARLLIEAGANVNAIHNRDETLLHRAITLKNFDVAKFLVEKGADVNATQNRNRTLLHYAIIKNYSDIAELLIQNGADVHAIYYAGEPILHYAISQKTMHIAKLIAEKARVNFIVHRGETPLYYAHKTKNTTIANLLIQKGADSKADNDKFDKQGQTLAGLLHHASMK